MPSPFPGMDPYLENPDLWMEVHHRLITALADAIAPLVRPKYRVAIEKRVYLQEPESVTAKEVGMPDVVVIGPPQPGSDRPATATLPAQSQSIQVTLPMPQEMREGYLEIREVETGAVVTVIEVLSPTNKKAGKGRESYESKRQEVLSSPTHLVEIDLLRGGKPMPVLPQIPNAHYRILISVSQERPAAQLYAFNLQQAVPPFRLPLQHGDAEVWVDLQSLLAGVYERAGFDLAIDYGKPPVPPLEGEDRTWAADWLARSEGVV